MEDRTIDTIMLPKIPLTIAVNNPIHRKRSIVYSLFGFFLLYKWNTYHAINAVSRWHITNQIDALEKTVKSILEKRAQSRPGTSPQQAVTAIVSRESRYSGKTIMLARIEPK